MSGFLGRLLFAFVFLSSGMSKLSQFDMTTGGPVMEQMAPKMDLVLDKIEALGLKIPASKALYPPLLLAAIFLEVCGGVLFLLNKRLGAQMLLLFLVAVTPIMHAWWNLPPNSPERLSDTINFYKNFSLAGALLFYLAMRQR